MRRPPRIGVVPPRIGTRRDGGERVVAVAVGDGAAGAGEVRVERRRVAVDGVDVAAGGIGLPDLDQRIGEGVPVLVYDRAVDDDALAERLAGVLAGQVGIRRADMAVA